MSLRPRAFTIALAFAATVCGRAPALAAPPSAVATASFWYAGTRLMFDHPQLRAGVLAVGSNDSGLARFLAKLGATLSYRPGGNAIVVTTGDRRLVTFAIGAPAYAVDGVTQTSPFAPYVADGVAYLPFLELARALYVVPIDDDTATVLQPQIAALDVRAENRVTVVTLRGASPLHFKRLSDAGDDRVSLAFLGIASTLERERTIAATGLRSVDIVPGGSPRNPATVVTFDAPPGSTHVLVPSDSANEITIAFAPPGVALGGTAIPVDGTASVATAPLTVRDARVAVAAATPAPRATAAPARGAIATPTALALPVASIENFSTVDADGGADVHLSIAGDVTYEWHRLSDNRWYVDLKPATLAIAPQDLTLQNPAISSLRIKGFVGPSDRLQTVRVAMTLASPRIVNLVPDGDGLTIAVDRLDDRGTTRTETGEIAGGKIVAAVPLPQPVNVTPLATPAPEVAGTDPTWKFSPPAGDAPGGKLIVIDPGHGGSDTGAAHNGLTEAFLNLDISKRLRALLVARGWRVKLTRDGDTDVYGANASAHDELQARDDVASELGARFFISVHTNSFTSSGLNGTTTYYFNPDSYAFAQAVHARLASNLPTKDDGVRKENFYVIHHAKMPSILIETAFLSNPGDAALLKSDAFLQSVAVSIADGVRDFATSQGTTVSSHPAVSVDGQ